MSVDQKVWPFRNIILLTNITFLVGIDLVVFSHSCQTYDPAVVGFLSRLEMPIISEMKFPHLVKGSEVQGITTYNIL